MRKQKKLEELQPGDIFSPSFFDIDHKFVVLKHEKEGTLVISSSPTIKKPFDKDSSNWKYSTLRTFLNNYYFKLLEVYFGQNNIISTVSDLTSEQGDESYGFCQDNVRLLTITEREKYHLLYPNTESNEWLLTPSFIKDQKNLICCDFHELEIDRDYCHFDFYIVRPVFMLNSKLIINIENTDSIQSNICKYCHTELEKHHLYCYQCGQKIDMDSVLKTIHSEWNDFAKLKPTNFEILFNNGCFEILTENETLLSAYYSKSEENFRDINNFSYNTKYWRNKEMSNSDFKYKQKETIQKLLFVSFPGGFLNENNEFILHRETNSYLSLKNINTIFEANLCILEYLSRDASISCPYESMKKNKEYNQFILNGINNFLSTNFSKEEMELIYNFCGNSVNSILCEKFVKSNYDLKILQ